jgi:hypothetical protein
MILGEILMRPNWRIINVECDRCGNQFATSHNALSKKAACPTCVATSLVFDRNHQIGNLPANLQHAYGLDRRGQPRKA